LFEKVEGEGHGGAIRGNRMTAERATRVGDPLRVEVITYAPTVFYHCQHCELTFQQMGIGDRVHRQEASEALPADLRQEFHALSDWVHRIQEEHRDRVQIRVVDAASIEGFWKSLRHGARRYPAVILDGKRRLSGSDIDALDAELQQHLAPASLEGGDGSTP
jgi:glutaredoxin